jgi:tetratricopeptide (TPR) repeat protein
MGQKSGWVFLIVLLTASACASRGLSKANTGASTDRTFDASLKEGLSYMARGEYRLAAEELRSAVEAKPDSPKAHNYLGLSYFQLKDYDPAKEQFEKAAALDPSFATAYNNLAGVYSIKRQFAQAEELYKKALALAPDLVSANYSLGILLTNLGRTEEGTGLLSRGIALDPEYLENHKDMVTTFTSLSFDVRETFFTYAKAYAAAGDLDKTVKYLEKAREAGFADWPRILTEKEFEKVRDDPRIRNFLKGPDARRFPPGRLDWNQESSA